MKKQDEMNAIESGDIPYKYYPQITIEMAKGIAKSLYIKRKFGLDKRIKELKREYKKIIELYFSKEHTETMIYDLDKFMYKILVWYEYKYPNDELTSLFSNENISLNQDFFDKKDGIKNTKSFFIMLTETEKNLISIPKYPDIDIKKLTHKEVTEIIKKHNDFTRMSNIVLDIILYSIIKYGDIRTGPERGLLFAKEFDRDIDIPMMYGVDTTDSSNINFINIYLNNGGNKDLNLFINYFYDGIASCMFNIMSVEDYIISFYKDKLYMLDTKKEGISILKKQQKN